MKKLFISILVIIIILSGLSCNVYGFNISISKRLPKQVKEQELVTGLNLSKSNLRTIKKQLYSASTSDRITLLDLFKLIISIKDVYSNIDLGPQELTNSKQLARLSAACASSDSTGPITVTPAVLKQNSVKTDITLITLGGTEFVDGQATNITTDILSGLEINNDYLRAVVNLFKTNDSNGYPIIPKDKPIVVAGISLGGMVAQQLLAQKYITENYKIINVVSFGSPIICPNYRTNYTTVRRLCDTKDIVPALSVTEILDLDTSKLDTKERVDKNGGYKSFIGAHVLSYVDADCWNSFDVLGFENGNASIELLENVQFYDAPLQ